MRRWRGNCIGVRLGGCGKGKSEISAVRDGVQGAVPWLITAKKFRILKIIMDRDRMLSTLSAII